MTPSIRLWVICFPVILPILQVTKNARTLIRQMERDELVEELVRSYLKKK